MSIAPTDVLERTLNQVFGFGAFRPGQEAVCRAVLEGRDALVVMPTGSGKSLCYRLPGVALGGTTVVISPLIALMEDQVAKLEANGLRADRIHSGRSRELSRAAAVAYRDSKLQFLFIAPERLAVPGFPEFWRSVNRRLWRSMKRIAFRSGGTIFVPTTGCCGSTFHSFVRLRSWR